LSTAHTAVPEREVWNGAIRTHAGPDSASQVAIIGAGPYGLAAAAHLRDAGLETHIFGDPMSFWRRNMPRGMKLRSPWRGSHIADPYGRFSLDSYAEQGGIEHAEPLPIGDFLRYADWFQREAVPDVDRRMVARIESAPHGFRLILGDGEHFRADRVVVATGLARQALVPAEFTGIPRGSISHSCDWQDFAELQGRRVAVIGRGQSACEYAVLISEAGGEVELISRGPVHWLGSQDPGATEHSYKWRAFDILTPPSPVGPFPLNWLADTPGLMHMFPKKTRDRLAQRCLRPAASAWLRPRAGAVRMMPGRTVVSARAQGSTVTLNLSDGTSTKVDHVLLATGYQIDITRQGILAPALIEKIRRAGGSPVLGRGLESSVTGLHFAGCTAVSSFGPLMRFIWGAGYAARAITRTALESA